jgi:hypothetical protein
MKLIQEDRLILENKYGKMTDKFWNILVLEADEAETEDELIEVIKDVYTFKDDYEKEYEFWQEFKSSDKTSETLDVLLEKYK